MATETQIQELIHKLEEGGWAKWLRLAALFAALLYLSYAWLFGDNGFKGLSSPRAMEQAEIAREMARGHGFSTRIIRPAELWLYRQETGAFPVAPTPDTYHGPLWPTVLAPFLLLVRSQWTMTVHYILYPADRVIAGVSLICFFLSVLVQFFIARRLFDQRLAIFGVALMLLCDAFWRFSMTGLPQMFMLLLFSGATYALLRLIEDQEDFREQEQAVADADRRLRTGQAPEGDLPPHARFGFPWWAVWTGLAFGLLALTHALTLWIFAGALCFALLYCRLRRFAVCAVLVGMVALCYTPWLVRNYRVCGSAFGVSWYSGLYQIRGTENSIMRSKEPPLQGVSPAIFRRKIQTQLLQQIGRLPLELGYSLVAPIFFIALLHPFKRRSTANFRWGLLLMWSAAVVGMSVFGLDEETYQANNLHLLFIPAFSFYGMAYALVLWSRLEIRVNVLRYAFFTLLFLLSGLPFLFTFIDLHSPPLTRIAWPPYAPPFISLLNTWTNESEIIMTDMPWAVSWYADRRSLWLPGEIKDYLELNDYDTLKGSIVGLYLTPVSGYRSFLSDIYRGEYKEWSPFILRIANLKNFPLKAATPMPVENECVFYADRDRWTVRED